MSLLADESSQRKNLISYSDQPHTVVDLCENSASQETKTTEEKAQIETISEKKSTKIATEVIKSKKKIIWLVEQKNGTLFAKFRLP